MALFSAASRVLFSANYAPQCELRANARLSALLSILTRHRGIVNRNTHNNINTKVSISIQHLSAIISIVLLEGHAIPTDVGIAFWVIFEGLNQKLINTNIIMR